MADSRLLQAGINDERFKALLELLDRQAEIDLSVVDVIDVDNVDASALIHLADQYNVLGYRGWLLCETEEAKRNLVKTSINLHRYAGTAWAIETAIKAVGFDGAEVLENPASTYDGVIDYDAEEAHDGRFWGAFIVDLNAGDAPLSNARVLLVQRLIEEWKNVRSHLLRLIAFRPLLHTGRPSGPDDLFDGGYNYDGSIDYTRPFTFFYDGDYQYDGVLNRVE